MNLQKKLLHQNDINCRGIAQDSSFELKKSVDRIRDTINLLENNFTVMRYYEVEQLSKFRKIKIFNEKLSNDLKESQQNNTKMLNLFRADVTDDLPNDLKYQVRRSWQQKYDALLETNRRLRGEAQLKDIAIREKDHKIAVLEQQLLNTGEKLVERDKVVQNICNKYQTMKVKKDEQDVLIRGSIETLQDLSLMKTGNLGATSIISRMSLLPTKESLLAYETRRSDRLIRENSMLRTSLQQFRVNCKCNYNLDDTNFDNP